MFMVSIERRLLMCVLMSAPISYATAARLTAWTFWYTPRSERSAETRRAAAEQTESAA
jgi:hypothetical protein